MKKLVTVITFVAFAMIAQADISMPKQDTLYDKLGRGFGNIIGAPNEILDSVVSTSSREGGIAGVTKGLIQGVSRTVMDIGYGTFEVVTGPLPVGPYFSYQTWKQPAWNTSLVQEYPPSDLVDIYNF